MSKCYNVKIKKTRYTDFGGLEYKSVTKYEEFLLIFRTPDFRYYIECINGKVCMFTFLFIASQLSKNQLSFTGNCYTHLINKPSPSDMKFPNCVQHDMMFSGKKKKKTLSCIFFLLLFIPRVRKLAFKSARQICYMR